MMQEMSSDSVTRSPFTGGGLGEEERSGRAKAHHSVVRRSFEKSHYPQELGGLVRAVGVVRRRILANTFLVRWVPWWSWILLGLLVAAAFSHRLVGAVIGAGVLIGLAGAVSLVWAWWTGPSAYGVAARLDSAAGLYDRLSTALHFANVENPGGMLLHQRRDALERLSQVDAPALFPIQMPVAVRRTLVLTVAVMGLLVYRLHYNPPMTTLVQKAASSHLGKALLTPLVEAMKRDFFKTVALVDPGAEVKASPDAAVVPGLPDSPDAEEAQRGESGMSSDDASQQDPDAGDAAEPGDPGEAQEGEPGSDQQGQAQNAPDQNQAGNPQEQQQASSGQPSGSNGNGSNEQQQQQQQSSGAQSFLQALKNLMKNANGQQPQDSTQSADLPPGEQPPGAEGSQQSGNTPVQGSKAAGMNGNGDQQSGPGPNSKKPGQGAGNGTSPATQSGEGKQPGLALPKNTLAQRVSLDSTDYRQQGHTRTSAAPGTAEVPLRDLQPQPVAAVKGEEQENIPMRYRLYVQRYFEHGEKGQP